MMVAGIRLSGGILEVSSKLSVSCGADVAAEEETERLRRVDKRGK